MRNKYDKPHDSLKEPLIHLVRRTDIPAAKAWLIRILCVLAGMLVCALFIMSITSLNPVSVFASMFSGAPFSPRCSPALSEPPEESGRHSRIWDCC